MAAREVHVKPTRGHARVFRDEGQPAAQIPEPPVSPEPPEASLTSRPELPPASIAGLPPAASSESVRSVQAPSSAAQPGSSAETEEQIRRDIEHTRARLDMTIDSIQERLSPRYLAQQAKNAMKTRSQQTGNRIVNTIKHHPMPAALTGVGLTWLIASAMRERSGGRQGRYVSEAEYEYEYTGEYPVMYRPSESEFGHTEPGEAGLEEGEAGSRGEQLKQAGRSAAQSAKEKASHLGEQSKAKAAHLREQARAKASQLREQARAKAAQLREQAHVRRERLGSAAASTAASLRDQASHTGSQIAHQASAMGHQVKEQASHVGQQVKDQAAHAGESARDIYEDYPMAVALGALAAGLLAGLALPATAQEDRWMGQKRDELLRGAKDYSGQILEKGQAVAERAVDAATEEAQRQGMTGEPSSSTSQRKQGDDIAQPGGDKI